MKIYSQLWILARTNQPTNQSENRQLRHKRDLLTGRNYIISSNCVCILHVLFSAAFTHCVKHVVELFVFVRVFSGDCLDGFIRINDNSPCGLYNSYFYRTISYASAFLEVVILSVRLSIHLSVCLSVRHTRALWQNQTMYCRYLDTTRKGNHSGFLTPTVIGWRRYVPSEICVLRWWIDNEIAYFSGHRTGQRRVPNGHLAVLDGDRRWI